MRRKFWGYLLVSMLIVGGITGLVLATRTYAGLPLYIPTPTGELACADCEVIPSGTMQPPPSEPLIPRENIIKGDVLSVKGNEVTINSTKHGVVMLLISPETNLWKGKTIDVSEIEVGDFFYGHGEPNADNTVFKMEQMEINIVNLRGGITKVSPVAAGLDIEMLESRSEKIELVHINAETMVSTENGQYPFGETTVEFKVDDGVQIIGVRLKDGTVLATRVF